MFLTSSIMAIFHMCIGLLLNYVLMKNNLTSTLLPCIVYLSTIILFQQIGYMSYKEAFLKALEDSINKGDRK